MISLSLAAGSDPRFQTAFAPYSPQSAKAFASSICTNIWSPIVWKDGLRTKKNFLSSQYMALDFDQGVTVAGMEAELKDLGLAYVLGLTKSHGKEKHSASGRITAACDRFRVILRAPLQTDRELYEYNMGLMADYFGCDESCTDAARFFYPCTSVVSVVTEGASVAWKPFDADYVPKALQYEARRKRLAEQGALGVPPKWVADILTGRVKVEAGDRHKTAYRLGCNFAALGWSVDDGVTRLMNTTLNEIGEQDVRRCVQNGFQAEMGN